MKTMNEYFVLLFFIIVTGALLAEVQGNEGGRSRNARRQPERRRLRYRTSNQKSIQDMAAVYNVQRPIAPVDQTPVDAPAAFPLGEDGEMNMESVRMLNQIESIDEMAAMLGAAMRPYSEDDMVGAVEMMKAGCSPELQTVQLDLDKYKNGEELFPKCVRLARCGGCCNHPSLECMPEEQEKVKIKVMEYAKSSSYRRIRQAPQFSARMETVVKTNHTKCSCRCMVTEQDCSVLQVYDKDNCRCQCKNQNLKDNCLKGFMKDVHYWSNDDCECSCRQPLDCGAGTYFSNDDCRCHDSPLLEEYEYEQNEI